MKCEQVNHAGGGNPGTNDYCIIHEAQFTEEELPMRNASPTEEALPLDNSLQIQAAEYWLKLGEADLALKELEKLPTRIWRCRWALKTRIAAIGVLREKSQVGVQN